MAGRKIRDAAEARACLAEVARSGMARAAWARVHGYDARSLNAWRLNLGDRRPRRETLRMVELTLEAPASRSRYVVHLGDVAVEVDDDFDEGTLRRLLHVVAAC